MADETPAETLAEVEAAPAPTPAAISAPAVDQEKEQLRVQVAQMQGALQEVANKVQSGQLKFVEQAATPEPEDDTALVDRKELKRREAEMAQRVAGAIYQQTQQTARLSRANTVDLLKPQLKNYSKYETEINAILDKVQDPLVAANPETIRKAYKIVRAEHLDEEIAEEVAARGALRSDEDEDAGSEMVSGRIAGSLPSSGRSGVAPVGDANFSRGSAGRADVAVKPLSRDEKIVVNQIFQGLFKDAAEYRKYADKNWKPDMLGSKGRTRF